MKYYTTKEIASKLKYQLNTVQKKISSGEIKAVKVGREWRISEKEMFRILGEYVNEPLFYTPQEVAKILQYHIQTIEQMLRNGEIKSIKLGRARGVYRIPKSELEKFLEVKRG